MDLKKVRGYSEFQFRFGDKNYKIKLCSYFNKEGFNHKAELYEILFNDFLGEILTAKKIIRYLNRTWERFTFESVILGVFNKAFKSDYLRAFNNLMEYIGTPENKKDLREEGSV